MKKYIKTSISEYLNENNNFVDFSSFPKNILKTLENEYFQYYQHNFDWNSKQDEFIKDGVFDGKGFREWLENNKQQEFIKNLDKLITYTRQDLILKIKQRNAAKVLKDFEELIIPVLGDEIKVGFISKYLATALLLVGSVNTDINYINQELSKHYQEAKEIIDKDGSLNYSKIEQSELFDGNDISVPNFERFVEKNPEYKGVFDDWKKLFDIESELSLVDLKAFRSSTPYSEIKDLYNFLIDFRNKNKSNK